MNDGHLVIAFHGCDITTRDLLVSGWSQPQSSKNPYDWLGPGFYVFEGDSERALAFATAAKQQPMRRLTARPIATPAVVGCLLNIQRCLDLTTRKGLSLFASAVQPAIAGIEDAGAKVPKNLPANDADTDVILRKLDNAVFTFIHREADFQLEGDSPGYIHYQAVRGAFRQGPPLAENSGFHSDSHIQIAIRDRSCIVGWFLLPGEELLDADGFAQAEARLNAAAVAYRKPTQRITP